MTDQQIKVRRPQFDLSTLPARWAGGSRVATHFGNAGHVFIPLGEEFFIDTVRSFRDRLDDVELRDAVKAFVGQEAVHKRAHEQLWTVLRERGVPVDAYARVIAGIRSVERLLPASFRLSVTAALEHYTASFGHSFLTEDLATAVPDEMARLLAWHGLEELEHRSVAFDVLRTVDGGYVLRVGGFAFATALILVVPAIGVVMFAVAGRAERGDGSGSRPSDLRAMSLRFLRRTGRHLADYLRPSFHPREMAMPDEAAHWATLLDEAC